MVPTLERSLIFVHRWLGVLVSPLFVIWFASAIGMMYWDFPSVTSADRLAHAATSIRRPLASSEPTHPVIGWTAGCITDYIRSTSLGCTSTVRYGTLGRKLRATANPSSLVTDPESLIHESRIHESSNQ